MVTKQREKQIQTPDSGFCNSHIEPYITFVAQQLHRSENKMTMTAATKDSLDLCDAILGNSASLVEYCLHAEGKDPNYNPTLNLYEDVPKDDDDKVDASEKLLGEDADYVCSPLHVAILNCYHNGRMDGIAHKQRIAALKILDLLLEAGADTSTTCNKVLFCNVGDLNISSPGAPLDPIALTLSLKKVRQSSVHADEKVDMMDQVSRLPE
jgi:hypothetical protein